MKWYILILIIFLSACCPKTIPITHKEQLILDVPQELLEEPKALKQL